MALTKDLARAKAQEVLAEHWDGSIPVDPMRLAIDLGMDVYTAALPEDHAGMIIKRDGEPAAIYLNASDPGPRQNFTCAHELGHWFEREEMNDGEFSFVDRRDDRPNDAREWYAEHFAANLLMPARPFIEAHDAGYGVSDLASRFRVSLAAARSRCRSLGLGY